MQCLFFYNNIYFFVLFFRLVIFARSAITLGSAKSEMFFVLRPSVRPENNSFLRAGNRGVDTSTCLPVV